MGRSDSPSALFAAAAAGYGANCALGGAVALRLIDTRRFRWVHHALYILTCTLVGAALVAGWARRSHPTDRRAALALAPAVVPLAVIPFAGTRGRRHPLIALAAAPFVVAALILSHRSTDRK
ncbi:hypothetical protein ACWGJP_04095 [Microbacterium sp. NPDC055903]